MTLLELLRQLEAQLGSHQLPLNSAAKSIKDIFESSPLHHDFMKRLVQAIYTGNGCNRLTDNVDRDRTLAAIAPLRMEVLRSERTDVDLYRLIEELCTSLDKAFGPVARPVAAPKVNITAQIIQFASFRRRRVKSLA